MVYINIFNLLLMKNNCKVEILNYTKVIGRNEQNLKIIIIMKYICMCVSVCFCIDSHVCFEFRLICKHALNASPPPVSLRVNQNTDANPILPYQMPQPRTRKSSRKHQTTSLLHLIFSIYMSHICIKIVHISFVDS